LLELIGTRNVRPLRMRLLRMVDVVQETRPPAGAAYAPPVEPTTPGVVPVQVPVSPPSVSSMMSPLPDTWIVHGDGRKAATARKNVLSAAGFAAPVL